MQKIDQKRSRFARGISTFALIAGVTLAQPAMAQTTASLRGEGVEAGRTVTITDTVTGRSVTTTAQPNGTFTVVGLRPSTYKVEVEGGETENISLPVGQTVTVNLAPEETVAGAPATEGGAGEIVVTGRRDRTETRTATVSTSVSQQQIENLPQNDRNFLNFAALAPGVVVTPTAGQRRIQAGAVSSDNTNVFVDGLSLKNPINHGGVAGQNFSRGNPFPQEAVQEFKVDTQNFKAEYEQAGSAIITAVTKTGGTEFHGTLFGEWQPKAFISRPYFDRPGQSGNRNGTVEKPDYNRWQYGASLGGPIIKNVLHFFGAFEGTSQKLPSTSVSFGSNTTVPGNIQSQFAGSYPQDFDQKLYFGKLSLFASAADTINGSVFLRREKELRDFGGNAVPEHGRNIRANIDVYQVEWNHRGESWLNEFTAAYNTVTNGTPRISDSPEIVLVNGTTVNSGEAAFFGGNSFQQDDRQKSYTVKNNVTFFGGNHVVKAGAKVSYNEYSRLEDNRSNGSYYYSAANFTDAGTQIPVAARITTVPLQAAQAKNTQIGLFIQDDWTPDEHWTVNAGLRWDYETQAKNEDFVTPAKVAAALRAYQGWKAAGINAEDYISTGENRKPYWKAFQPRLGVSYDVNGDRDLIFFAGAGRYYDRPLFITAGIETIKNLYQSVSTIEFCNGTGVTAPPAGCVNFTSNLRDPAALRALATAQGTGGEVWLLNNDTKLPFSDQFSLGVRKRFGEVQTSLTYSHIRSHNIFQFVRGNRYENGWYTRIVDRDAAGNVTGCRDGGILWVQDNFQSSLTNENGTPVPTSICAAQNGNLAGFSGKLNIGQNNGKAVYNAIYLTVDKPYTKQSGWGFTISATAQRARTNVGTELGADEFFAGPRVDQFGWEFVQGVNQYNVVATGQFLLPADILFSATGTFASGPAFGYAGCPPTGITPPGPTPDGVGCIANLGGVRFPSNEFAYANVDLRVTKTFTLPWGHELQVKGEVFNAFDSINRNYVGWGAGTNPPSYDFDGDGTVGNARQFQVGMRYKF